MPDTGFIAAFANNPLTLTILMIATIIVVFIWKVSPFFKELADKVKTGNETLTSKVDTLMNSDAQQVKDIGEMKLHLRNTTLDVLRITIYNEGVDIEDRLVSARRYFLQGGNGKVATFVRTLTEQNPSVWKAILAMSTDEERATIEKVLA
jgi:hypothetical protein